MSEETNSIEQFLTELEKWILKQEHGIEHIKENQQERKYIEDLLEVLRTSITGFAIEVYASKDEKKQEFYRILKKVISDDREYHHIVSEIKNLYYLNESGLMDNPIVKPQQDAAESAIETIIQKSERYLWTIKGSKEEERLKELYRFMELLFNLATKFDNNQLVEEIDDIEFFQEIMREIELPSATKLVVITHVFERMNELSKKQNQKKRRKNAYQELEDFYEDNNMENTEELLDELLGEEINRFTHH